MGGMTSTSHPTVPTEPVATAEFITNSLSTRLPEFVYDPDNGCTFEVWYNRYEDVISKDSATLDDAARARLIVSTLNAITYARFTNHILPKRASNVPLPDTGLVNQCHAVAEFNDVTPERMKCLAWICGPVAARCRCSRSCPSQDGGQPSNHAKGACCRGSALSRHSSGCRTPQTIKCTACQRRGFAKESKSWDAVT
ncbi:hypothetical protein RB195_018041 [Necator americanus]